MMRQGNFLPGVNLKVYIVEGKTITVSIIDIDGVVRGLRAFNWNDQSEDFWADIEFNGETYALHIDNDEAWSVALNPYEIVPTDEGREKGWTQIDTSLELTIHEANDPELIVVRHTCHISGSEVAHESNGDGISEYDMCCECDEKTHPDEMVTLPEDDDRMEICSECKGGEEKQEIADTLIEQIKKDITNGDTTVLDMILMKHSKEYLKGCLPE